MTTRCILVLLLSALGTVACASTSSVGSTHTTAAHVDSSTLRLDLLSIPDRQWLDVDVPVEHMRSALQYGFANAVAVTPLPPSAANAVLVLDEVTPRTEVVNGVKVVSIAYSARWLGPHQTVLAAYKGTARARSVTANGRELADAIGQMYEQLFAGFDEVLRVKPRG